VFLHLFVYNDSERETVEEELQINLQVTEKVAFEIFKTEIVSGMN